MSEKETRQSTSNTLRIMIKIILKDNKYIVKQRWYSDIEYDTFDKEKELCRLRLGTTLQENNIKVIKVPFINLWLVW